MPRYTLPYIKRNWLALFLLLLCFSVSSLLAQEIGPDSLIKEAPFSTYTKEQLKDSLSQAREYMRKSGYKGDKLKKSREKGVKLARLVTTEAEGMKDTSLWVKGLQVLEDYERKKETRDSVRVLGAELVVLHGLQLEEVPREEDSFYEKNISTYLTYYPDSTAKLTFEEILKLEKDSSLQFHPNDRFIDNPWSSLFVKSFAPEHIYWGKIIVRGHPEEDIEALFTVSNATVNWSKVDIYAEMDDGTFDHQIVGDKVHPEEKRMKQFRNYFKVFIPKRTKKDIYVRLDASRPGSRSNGLAMYMFNEKRMLKGRANSRFKRGIFFGIILIQTFYFLLMAFSTRETTYFYYVLYIFGLLMYVSNILFYGDILPTYSEYKEIIIMVAYLLIGIGIIKFSEAFLNLEYYLPRWRNMPEYFLCFYIPVILLLIGLLVAKISLDDWVNTSWYRFWVIIGVAALGLSVLIGSILILIWSFSLVKKYKPVRFFIIATAFFLIGILIPVMGPFFAPAAFSKNTSLFFFSTELGIVLQLSFFALGVGAKVNLLKEEKTETLAKSLRVQEEANDKLRQADKLKDEFLANTSHELRTPLNGIIGISESLLDGVAGELNTSAKENLSLVAASGKRLSSLVNDILDFSKLKNFEIELQNKILDVKSLVEVVLRISESTLQGKQIELINDMPEDLPLVWADENRLQQVLFNLVGNAIKFTSEGQVRIFAKPEGEFLTISVEDTGMGIPKERQERVFLSFEQGDGSVSRSFGGTGLGLSITKQLVELHGGHISLESEEGEGATFTFTIPLSTQQDISPQQITEAHAELLDKVEMSGIMPQTISPAIPSDAPAPLAMPKEGLDFNKNEEVFRILIVDDEPINQQVLKNYLSREQFLVVTAMNGEEALQAIEREADFDLVLLDVMMPRMSGFEVCQKLRERYLPAELPIIMITAKNQVNDLVHGLSYGANDYLTKPVSRQELLARIKTHLNLRHINTAYGKFVPREFLTSLGHDSILDARLGDGVEKEFTVFFSDIRSYTTISEQMTPKENFDFLNAYLGRVGPIIKKKYGFVNQYFGDGIMALFPRKAADAVQAAISIQKTLDSYNEERLAKNRIPVHVGIGLHTGPLMMGIIGDSMRMDAAVVSDTVNTASRMEGLTKHYHSRIIISEDTFKGLEEPQKIHHRFLGKVVVKGRKGVLGIYDVFEGDREEIAVQKMDSLSVFEQAVDAYYEKNFKEAMQAFQEVLGIFPTDQNAKNYLQKIEQLSADNLPETWDGVERFVSK